MLIRYILYLLSLWNTHPCNVLTHFRIFKQQWETQWSEWHLMLSLWDTHPCKVVTHCRTFKQQWETHMLSLWDTQPCKVVTHCRAFKQQWETQWSEWHLSDAAALTSYSIVSSLMRHHNNARYIYMYIYI